MIKRRGLGRGLEALIPLSEYGEDAAAGKARDQQILRVPIRDIRPNPDQPRRTFAPETLQELADSIRLHGILQPLLVREAPDGYELIAGERRLRAAEMAGLEEVPVIIHSRRSTDASEWLELSLIENLQREDLNPIEEARAIKRLVAEFGFTVQAVAERLGKSHEAVSNAKRLLDLPDRIISAVEIGAISANHARALLGLPSPAQMLVGLDRILREHWTARQTEAWVRACRQGDGPRRIVQRQRRGVDAETLALEDELRKALGTKVLLTRFKEGGRLIIEFYSDEELDALRLRLTRT